jgi:hypothetical protein
MVLGRVICEIAGPLGKLVNGFGNGSLIQIILCGSWFVFAGERAQKEE